MYEDYGLGMEIHMIPNMEAIEMAERLNIALDAARSTGEVINNETNANN